MSNRRLYGFEGTHGDCPIYEKSPTPYLSSNLHEWSNDDLLWGVRARWNEVLESGCSPHDVIIEILCSAPRRGLLLDRNLIQQMFLQLFNTGEPPCGSSFDNTHDWLIRTTRDLGLEVVNRTFQNPESQDYDVIRLQPNQVCMWGASHWVKTRVLGIEE